jgi:hypothetical protein
MEDTLRCVFVASGEIEAQQVRGFLRAAGIDTVERGESLRHTHGFTLDGVGAVEILVADADVARARDLLDSADRGMFRVGADPDTPTGA